MNNKKTKKQFRKTTKNEVALKILIKKFAKENNIYVSDFTSNIYEEIAMTLKREELDYETMLKLMERFK